MRDPDTLDYPPAPPDECRYCGGEVQQMSQKKFYGRDYGGGLYVCEDCEARVGMHEGTGKPLGLLADAELRSLRSKVHDLFDPMWEENGTDRTEAYNFFFGKMLGLPKERRHVGMMTQDECKTAIRILKAQ